MAHFVVTTLHCIIQGEALSQQCLLLKCRNEQREPER